MTGLVDIVCSAVTSTFDSKFLGLQPWRSNAFMDNIQGRPGLRLLYNYWGGTWGTDIRGLYFSESYKCRMKRETLMANNMGRGGMLHSTSVYGMQMQTTMQYCFIILKEAKLMSNHIKDLQNVKKKWLKSFGEKLSNYEKHWWKYLSPTTKQCHFYVSTLEKCSPACKEICSKVFTATLITYKGIALCFTHYQYLY